MSQTQPEADKISFFSLFFFFNSNIYLHATVSRVNLHRRICKQSSSGKNVLNQQSERRRGGGENSPSPLSTRSETATGEQKGLKCSFQNALCTSNTEADSHPPPRPLRSSPGSNDIWRTSTHQADETSISTTTRLERWVLQPGEGHSVRQNRLDGQQITS